MVAYIYESESDFELKINSYMSGSMPIIPEGLLPRVGAGNLTV